MSKKKFKKGLESLFGDWGGEPIEDVVLELDNTEDYKSEPEKSKPHAKKDSSKRANAGKNFTMDLDSLFQEVVQESIEEQFELKKEKEKEKKKNKNKKVESKSKPERKKRRVIPRSGGIDSLIRSTVEGSIMQIESTSNKKRVSFVFDKEKLKKLKSIAKVKKSYLKDVIDEVVAEYLAKHESKFDNLED
ncbi:MAG: hypothetical protein AB8F94_26540 [Saprospiraceae bacterium]